MLYKIKIKAAYTHTSRFKRSLEKIMESLQCRSRIIHQFKKKKKDLQHGLSSFHRNIKYNALIE